MRLSPVADLHAVAIGIGNRTGDRLFTKEPLAATGVFEEIAR